MKLAYKTAPKTMAGSAVPGCGTIHKSEVFETLTRLSGDLNMPFDFGDFVVGSTGKREYSGDIDVVVPSDRWDQNPGHFREGLEAVFGKDNVARNGSMIHLKYPIVSYKEDLQEIKPRTGFVQVDFLFGKYEWLRFYHFSDAESAYKGAHRNLIMSAICAAVNTIESKEVDTNNRPTEIIRYKFGDNGLYKVRRTSQRDSRSGQWMKKQHDEVLDGPIRDPAMISKILLPCNGTPEDLFSLESIMGAVKRNYGMTDCERIWKRAAANFYNWSDGRNFAYPPEITEYIPSDDK